MITRTFFEWLRVINGPKTNIRYESTPYFTYESFYKGNVYFRIKHKINFVDFRRKHEINLEDSN